MWTRRSRLIVASVRIGSVRIPIAVLPLRCAHEIIEGFIDVLSLVIPKGVKPRVWISTAQMFLEELQAFGRLDFVDVDIKSKDQRVKFKLLMR